MSTTPAEIRVPLRVRYAEVDAQGFVFNAHYLAYADVAMTEYFRALGRGYPELLRLGFDPSLVASELRFRAPARLDDELVLAVACEHVGRTSLVLRTRVLRDELELADIRNVYVNVEPDSERSRPVPDEIRAAVERRGIEPPQEGRAP